ncbi:MAG: hypothetical protein Q8O40_11595 [Chloroflexota bacterium]|nr:hypothetical protein [Chloroflexota bacterium]
MVNEHNPIDKCQRLSGIRPGDVWWFYQCAGAPEDTSGELSERDIRSILSHLETVFDNKWYVRWGNTRNKGICASLLIGGVQHSVDNIMRLASNIRRLGGIDKLPKAAANLRNLAKCLNTVLELEVLACFVEEGFTVTPYPVLPSGAIPEAKVKVGDTDVYVEVTHMDWPRPEDFPGIDWKSKQGTKLVEKCIGEVSQLPRSECGVVVMNPPTLIDEEVGRNILASFQGYLSPELYTRISGMILANKLVERSGFIRACPIVLVNACASRRCDSALERLAEALWKHPKPPGELQ